MNPKGVNFKGVTMETWVRTIAMMLVLMNQLAVSFLDFQFLPYADDQIYEGVSAVVTVVVTIWAAWKNNSFTHAAQAGDTLMNARKE